MTLLARKPELDFKPEKKVRRTAYCRSCYRKRISKKMTEADFIVYIDNNEGPCKHCGANPRPARRARLDEMPLLSR